jgi:bacteriorhodopsin
LLYMPMRTFTYLALPFVLVGGVLWLRYFFLWIAGETTRGSHIQSVTVGGALLMLGFLVFIIGLIGDLIAINRRMHEETLYYLKRATLLNQNDDALFTYTRSSQQDQIPADEDLSEELP